MSSGIRGMSLGLGLALLSTATYAEISKTRLLNLPPTNLAGLVTAVNAAAGTTLRPTDFMQAEGVQLSKHLFLHFVQKRIGMPIRGTALRVWVSKADGKIVVAEAHLDKPSTQKRNSLRHAIAAARPFLQSTYLESAPVLAQQLALAKAQMAGHHDAVADGFTHEDAWADEDFQRIIKATGKRGHHEIVISHITRRVVSYDYREFQRDEIAPISVTGYRIYEQNWFQPGPVLAPEQITLKHLNPETKTMDLDPYLPLTGKFWSFAENQEALTQMGVNVTAATWSFASLDTDLKTAATAITSVPNGFNGPQGLVLDGKYVNVTVHGDIIAKLNDPSITWRYSDYLNANQARENSVDGLKLQTNLRGVRITSPAELLVAPVKNPLNTVSELVKQNADQVQTYWAVTEMMEKLNALGFDDPEISTRKFTAILYDPDPFYADNAFYTADTINFTMYSPGKPNLARDNTVIWHEIGHGIVERISGAALSMTKGQGFGEGMADFLAELVLQASSFQKEFAGRTEQRIYNKAPFNFANEVHDDGEAFGGFMKEVLDAAIARDGEAGVAKVADLTLDALRFIRNHPRLDEQEWVEKLRFADSLGSDKRASGEFATIIDEALKHRNFSADGKNLASMEVQVGDMQLTRVGSGTRNRPLKNPVGAEKRFDLRVRLKDGADYKFVYPVRVVVQPASGPGGPIDWIDEDNGAKSVTVENGEEVVIPSGFTGACDRNNITNGCLDGMNVEVFFPGESRPRMRQRVYFELSPTPQSILVGTGN